MRRLILAASCVLAVALPAVAQAKPPTREHVREYVHAYHAARGEFGARAVGCEFKLERAAARRRCHGRISDSAVIKSLGVLERMLTPPVVVVHVAPTTALADSATPTSAGYTSAFSSSPPPAVGSSSGGYGNVPGVPSSFASCVALRESTNGAGSSNIYGILPSNGYYSGMSIGAQKQLFGRMYAGGSGISNWRPYDGC